MTEPPAGRVGLTPLAREVAELRAAYQELPRRLVANHQFDGLWARFVEGVRPLVHAMDGEPWNPVDERIAASVPAVDDLRLDLLARQGTALPAYRDPLNIILQTSLRTPSRALYQHLFGRVDEFEDSGAVTLRVVGLERFEAQVAECRGLIGWARREIEDDLERQGTRLVNLERALGEERAHALAIVEVPRNLREPTLRGVLEKWSRRGNLVARAALWVFGDRLRVWLAAAIPPALAALYYWLRK